MTPPSSMPGRNLRLPLLLTAVSTFVAQAQPAKPEFTYPAPSLPAIKLGNPLPETLAPSHTGGEIPNRPYRIVDTFAGSGSAGGNNATGTDATFNGPWGISRDAQGNFYVADFSGKRIRKVTPGGAVSLIDEFGSFEPIATAVDPATGHLYCSIATHRILRYVNKNAANYPAQEPVYGPETNFADSVIVYIGTSSSGTTDAIGINARLNAPHALSVHDGFLYIADKGNNRIRKVNLGTAAVETVPLTGGTLDGPEGLLVAPNGTIYVANTNGNDLIQKIENAAVTTYAGSASGYANGMAAFAKFDNPRGLAMDAEGHLYVAEGNNNAIRRISPDGWVTSIAGSTTGGYDASKGFTDAIGDAARFNSPRGLLGAGDGMLYVTDFSNHRIRRLSLTGYEIDPPLPDGLALDPATGVISGTATELTPENGELFPHYQNAFQTNLGSATLHGAAELGFYGKVNLVPDALNKSGGITIPAGNLNVQELEVSFQLETGKGSGGGQGFSYNFGEGVSGGSTAWPYAEGGIGTGLSLTFDPLNDPGTTIKGVRLLYGTKVLGPGATPGVNGVLAHSPNVAWAGKASTVKLSVDALSRVTVTLDGETLFARIPLPPEYAAADKSKWTHAFAARTDAAASDAFAIDDLSIRQSLEGPGRYLVTARNRHGSSTAAVTINIKESPGIVFNMQSVLKEDGEAQIHTPTGRDWNKLPPVASGSELLGPIAGDVNARKLLVVKTNPGTTINRRTLHVYQPDNGIWSQVNASTGAPLYGDWRSVAANADGSVLVAVSGPDSSTNAVTYPSANLDIPGKIVWSTDGGTTWQTRPVGFSGAWAGTSVAISADGNTIYVGAALYRVDGSITNMQPGALVVTRNRGATWSELYPAGSPYPVFGVSCDATGTVIGVNAVAMVGSNTQYDRLLISSNSGASWVDRALPVVSQRDPLVRVAADGRSVYARNTYNGPLYVTRDLGATWRRANILDSSGPYYSDCNAFAISSDGTRLAYYRAFAMVKSEDAGLNFNVFDFEPVQTLRMEHLIANHSGRRLVTAYGANVYVSQGGGIELTHSKGESQVLTVTLGAPQGFLRVNAPEGVTVTGNGTANLTLTGPLGLINTTLESLTYQGGADFIGAAGFTITASASGVSTSETSELTVQDAAQPEMAAQATSAAVAQTTATLGGTVLADGGSAITRRGVVISPTLANPGPVRGGVEVIDLAATGTSLGAFTVNATGLLAGTSYSFRAYAVNANGPQYSGLGTFTTSGGSSASSPSASWRQQYFGTTENTGNAADLAAPDGDGVTNLMKYALGLTPGQNASGSLPKGKIANNAGSRYLSLNFRRDPSRNDVTIVVEVIGSLGGSWTEIARSVNGTAFTGTAGVTEVDAGDGTKNVEIRDTQTVGSSLRRFMRVRAER